MRQIGDGQRVRLLSPQPYLRRAVIAAAGLPGNIIVTVDKAEQHASRVPRQKFSVRVRTFFIDSSRHYATWGKFILRTAVFFLCVIALQLHIGAYSSEGSDGDESSHLVTGMMFRDYLAHGIGKSPIRYAYDYYAHYPRVGLGHWPPMFYVEEAPWMLIFPATRNSVLEMVALMAALTAAWIYALLRPRYGICAAWCAGFALITIPGVIVSESQVMAEVPQSLLILGAMVALSRYLDTGAWPRLLQFAGWTIATLLTKGTGLALIPVPCIGIALTRRWRFLQSKWFWIAVLIVVLPVAAWYLCVPFAMHQKVLFLGGPSFNAWHRRNPPMESMSQFGFPLSMLVCVGLVITLVRAVRGVRMDSLEASATGMVISALTFPFFFRVWEERHRIEAAPEFILVAAVGLSWMGSLLPAWLSPRMRAAVLLAGTAGIMAWNVGHEPVWQDMGFRRLAQTIVHADGVPIESMLISSRSEGEGKFISELAQADTRPRRYVLRESKFLSDSDWAGKDYRYKFDNREQLEQLLGRLPIQLVIFDQESEFRDPHEMLFLNTLEKSSESWAEWHPTGVDQRFRLFRHRDQVPLQPADRVRIASIQKP
jgi:hypothetical protein